jgi:hypothetical protein
MGIPLNVLAFAEANDQMDLLIGFKDLYSNITKKGEFSTAKSLDEKNETIHNSIKKAVLKMMGVPSENEKSVANTTYYRELTCAVVANLIDSILPDTIIGTFGNFADVAVGGYGDSFKWDIRPSDLFTVTKAGNGKRNAFAQRQFNGIATLIPENHMITVEEDLYRILAGKRNLAEYAVKLMQSMEAEIAYDVYAAVDALYGTMPAQFKEASWGEDSFVTLCQRVAAFNTGSHPVVFGTKLALSHIVPSNVIYNDRLGEEYYRTGYLGIFKGTQLFEISQKANWTSSTYALRLNDEKLYVISTGVNKLVKVALEGDTLTYADAGVNTNANLTQTSTINKKWAAAVISNAYCGQIDL